MRTRYFVALLPSVALCAVILSSERGHSHGSPVPGRLNTRHQTDLHALQVSGAVPQHADRRVGERRQRGRFSRRWSGRSFRIRRWCAWVRRVCGWSPPRGPLLIVQLSARAAGPTGAAQTGHRWMLVGTTSMAGVGWGSSVYFLALEIPLPYELVHLFVLGGHDGGRGVRAVCLVSPCSSVVRGSGDRSNALGHLLSQRARVPSGSWGVHGRPVSAGHRPLGVELQPGAALLDAAAAGEGRPWRGR
jgi:hypothetical protein